MSLSDAEASIVAPFTSKNQDISSLVQLLILGRASLDLSYELFKYLIVYTFLQFGAATMMFFTTNNFDDKQLLFIDLGGVVPITILLCWTDANTKLNMQRPVKSLFSKYILFSIIGQAIIQVGCTFSMYMCLRGQDFYVSTQKSSEETTKSFENSTIFLFSLPQYIFIGIAFHTATQFRRPLYTNIPFLLLLLLQMTMAGWLILGPLPFMRSTFSLVSDFVIN